VPRDKYVIEMDEYFNEPRFSDLNTDEERRILLSASEWELVRRELDKCREDFTHAASNWFWISHKSGETILFDLWDGQLLVVEKLKDMERRGKPQYVIVIKSRQLGLSQLGCALACWKCLFKSNQDALIMSEDDDKTKNLWNKYAFPIYRQLPWYLKPEAISQSIEKGLILDSDPKKSSVVGLRSTIKIVSASTTGFVQGQKLNMFHGSEFTSWPVFNDIIERGVENALYENPSSIAILESTAKGAGTATHSFWRRMVARGDEARWEPVFLPFFMDRTHVLPPKQGWKPQEAESRRRETIKQNWVKCDNRSCARYFDSVWGDKQMVDTTCRFCGIGRFRPFFISDKQLYWLQDRIANATEEETILQEQASTAEEAFQVKGDKVFKKAAIEYAAWSAEKSKSIIPYKGFMDEHGRFHGYQDGIFDQDGQPKRECVLPGCGVDHYKEDRFLTVWELPMPGYTYAMGVDVGEGIGKDYSVAVVNRIGGGTPDVQVATYRENGTDPYNLAFPVNRLGRWYNEALCAVEYTGSGSSTADILMNQLRYPNVYKRILSGDFFSKSQGKGYHWLTNAGSKPKLINTYQRWLLDEMIKIRDPELANEIKLYVRIDETKKTEAAKSQDKNSTFHDDYLMAHMIAVYTSHQHDFDQDQGVTPFKIDATPENQPYTIKCNRCGVKFGVSSMDAFEKASLPTKPRCPRETCGSMLLTCYPNTDPTFKVPENPFREVRNPNPDYFEGSNYGPSDCSMPYDGFS